MKNSIKITLGTILIATAGAFVFNNITSNTNLTNNYSPRINSFHTKARSAKGMMDFYTAMRANVNTGKVEASDYFNASIAVKNLIRNSGRAATLQFVDEGPDNVGGRTRAILIDRNDVNIVYAGSVSGGLFKSTNRGNTWSRVNAFNTVLSISSLAQTKSGTIYVATGAEFESDISNGASGGHRANGVWYSTDAGASFQQLTPPSSYGTASINAIVADPIANDKIWIGGQFPVRLTSCENKTTFTTSSDITGSVQDVQISKDGNVIVASQTNRTYVSTNSGASFARVSGSSAGQIKEIATSASITRIEYAISHEKNTQGKYNIYAAQIKSGSIGKLGGIAASLDNGQTWTEVIPETPNATTAAVAFASDPYSGGTQWQGNYDNIIAAIPGNPNSFIVGGVRLFRFVMSTTQPPFGNMYPIASNQGDGTSSLYVHSDIHEFQFDNTGRLYIGSDGGVGVCNNISAASPSFYEANRGYNVTQFYGIGYTKDGSLIGGSQDNSCVYKDATSPGTTSLEFRPVNGGDGFDSEISFLNPSAIFSSVQEGEIFRSPDKGTTTSSSLSSEMIGQPASFYTTMRLFENDNDINSTDSVFYYAQGNKLAGETIMVASKNMNILFPHVLTQNINVVYDSIFVTNDTLILGTQYNSGDTALLITARDTIRIQDKLQTLYATGLAGTGGVWVTRGILRFGTTPIWWKVLGSVDEVKSLEFSKDGNILYVGEFSGKVTRIKGFNNVYYNDEANDTINGIGNNDSTSYKYADIRSGVSQLEIQVIYSGGGGQAATGIAVDPNDPEHVVITLGGYGATTTHVIRSTTAASTTNASSFTSIQGNLPDMPVYDAIIDVTNSNVIVIGTEFGIYASDNFGVTWTPQTMEAGIVPVYAIRQQWRPWNKCNNPGVIYAGTHGRGIWSSSTLLGIEKNNTINKAKELTLVNVYPNPANQFTNIAFDLTERGDVSINVFNMQGKLVKTNTIKNASEGAFNTQLDINNLTKGTYFINIQAGNNKFKVAKFIKN